jgi:hypothetical protein
LSATIPAMLPVQTPPSASTVASAGSAAIGIGAAPVSRWARQGKCIVVAGLIG